MKIGSVFMDGISRAGIVEDDHIVLVRDLNEAWRTSFPEDLDGLIQQGALDQVQRRLDQAPSKDARTIPLHQVDWAPLLSRPRNIWGVGLNFRQHAKDLNADNTMPLPSGFHRPVSCLAGHGSALHIPTSWGTITGEAEIGAIIGKPIWKGSREDARRSIVGYTALLDLTAEELLRKNTRYIGRSKAFPESVAIGPYLVTPDEWEPTPDTTIRTLWNGKSEREGAVRDMTWDPWALLSDFSTVFPWHPGDLLQTGTPGAVPLQPGGTLGAQIDGLPTLTCPIRPA